MARGGIRFYYCILEMIGGIVGNLYHVIFRYLFLFFFSTRSFFLASQLPFQVIAFLAASPGQSPTYHHSPPPPTAWSMASVLILVFLVLILVFLLKKWELKIKYCFLVQHIGKNEPPKCHGLTLLLGTNLPWNMFSCLVAYGKIEAPNTSQPP